MSRETKLIIYGLIIVFSVIYKRVNVIMNSAPLDIATEKPALPISKFNPTIPIANEEAIKALYGVAKENGYVDPIEDFKYLLATDSEANDAVYKVALDNGYVDPIEDFYTLTGFTPGKANVQTAGVVDYPRPQQGFSPYDEYFGRGIYDKSVGNEFVIKNSNSTDAVVLLVNAYTKRKTRNEYIRKGATFKMTSVPNGTYYLEWTSGEAWNPNLYLGKVRGGFQENSSYAKTGDRNDWMQVSGWDQWTVTLYTTIDGDVNLEDINANEFGK